MSQDLDSTRPPVVTNLKNMEVTCMKVFCTLFSVVTYLADVILDILVADRLYADEEYLYFGLTVLFIAIPPIVMTIFTMFWYVADESTEPVNTPPLQWIVRIILLLFLMAPVLRTEHPPLGTFYFDDTKTMNLSIAGFGFLGKIISLCYLTLQTTWFSTRNLEALYYAFKSVQSDKKKAKDNYARRMSYENLDASMLRLFQAFVESAPQALLQLYIIGQDLPSGMDGLNATITIQVISVLTSLVSVSCAVASYQANLRASLDYKNDYNCSVAIFPFLWRFCELVSRLLTLGLFASLHLLFIPILFAMHFTIMFMVTRIISAGFCGNGPGEVLYNFLLSYMYFFCFINPKDDKTMASYTFYYCLNLTENAVLISVWYKQNLPYSIFALPVFVVVLSSFTLAVLIMIFYYTLLHPTRGKIYGRPSPIKPDDTIEHIENLAREFGLDEEIISRFRKERDNIPSKNAADFFQNVPEKGTKKKKSGKQQSPSQHVEDTVL